MIDEQEAHQHGVTAVRILELEWTRADERRLPEQALSAAAGRIKPVIGQTFPLKHATAAHAAIEAREVIGKTLLLTSNDPGVTGVRDVSGWGVAPRGFSTTLRSGHGLLPA